ncbi:MAG: DUF1489 domain-containing protein [Alphaproteobacteria bacterium]
MAMHLIKLCVGVESVEHLAALQAVRLERLRTAGQPAELVHRTRQMPRQRDAILAAGGSLYWVIKGAVLARQKILDLREENNAGGHDSAGDSKLCGIVLAPELIATRPQPRRAFQGWRYLKPEDVPADICAVCVTTDMDDGGVTDTNSDEAIPAAMRAQLAELALI